MKSSKKYLSFRNWPITIKITVSFLAVILAIFAIGFIILGMKWHNFFQQGLMARGQLLCENSALRINGVIDHAESINLVFLHQLELEKDSLSSSDLETVFNTIDQYAKPVLAGDLMISGVAVILEKDYAPDSRFYYFSYSGSGTNIHAYSDDRDYTLESWYKQARGGKTPFWVKPVQFSERPGLSSLYVTPLHNKSTGNFIGTLVVEISAETLQRYINSMSVVQESMCLLFHEDGTAIAASDNAETLTGEQVRQYGKPDTSSRGAVVGAPAKRNHIFYAPCENGWYVSIIMPEDWILARMQLMGRYGLTIFFLTLPFIFALSFVMTRRVTGPLTKLSEAAEAIGGGQFNVSLPPYKGDDEIGQLTNSFEQMQKELSVYVQELKKTLKQRQNMESEINIAKSIQMGILPKVESVFVESGQFDLDARLIPAKGVGGDLYDFFYLDENHLALIVGDVSGKGIPAALFMSVTQTLQRSIAFRFKEPAEIVRQLNKFLMMNNEASMFVTYFIGIIDTCSGQMNYCNAGHNLPFIRRNNGNLDVIGDQHGMPLGIFEDTYQCGEVMLETDDTIILYTDGITEAFNSHNELFGEIRLKEAISYAFSSDPHKIVHTILEHLEKFVEDHEQSDDITLLTLQMKNISCPVDGRGNMAM